MEIATYIDGVLLAEFEIDLGYPVIECALPLGWKPTARASARADVRLDAWPEPGKPVPFDAIRYLDTLALYAIATDRRHRREIRDHAAYVHDNRQRRVCTIAHCWHHWRLGSNAAKRPRAGATTWS